MEPISANLEEEVGWEVKKKKRRVETLKHKVREKSKESREDEKLLELRDQLQPRI